MFLETLIDFVAVHRSDLHDWLYVPLTRLLNKMGSDMLGSVQAKVQRALEAVRYVPGLVRGRRGRERPGRGRNGWG